MRITPQHLEFWREKKSVPSWMNQIERPKYSAATPDNTIHYLINVQNETKNPGQRHAQRERNSELNNAVNLLRLVRKNQEHANATGRIFGDEEETLYQYMTTHTDDSRRSKWYLRWIRKMEGKPNKVPLTQKQE